MNWTSTRAHALEQLDAFLPHAGADYAKRRNYDVPEANVSRLSPFIQRRLISEQEVVTAVLKRHDFGTAEMFIQEVCWRTYWKGWLAMRPGVWRAWAEMYLNDDFEMELSPAQMLDYTSALQGATGIDCFDHWVRQLLETGYLHNHARMWFASIWIFTLKLPWELGALFFFRHLIDADAASNTLSWRWVAGQQTSGKIYAARADNMAKYTGGRFNPAGQLNETPPETVAPDHAPARKLDWQNTTKPEGPCGLLITLDDCSMETELKDFDVRAAATWETGPFSHNSAALAFDRGALEDAALRSAATWNLARCAACPDMHAVINWATESGLKHVISPYPHIGPRMHDILRLRDALEEKDVTLVFHARAWDQKLYPLATRGFFPFKKKLPGNIMALIR